MPLSFAYAVSSDGLTVTVTISGGTAPYEVTGGGAGSWKTYQNYFPDENDRCGSGVTKSVAVTSGDQVVLARDQFGVDFPIYQDAANLWLDHPDIDDDAAVNYPAATAVLMTGTNSSTVPPPDAPEGFAIEESGAPGEAHFTWDDPGDPTVQWHELFRDGVQENQIFMPTLSYDVADAMEGEVWTLKASGDCGYLSGENEGGGLTSGGEGCTDETRGVISTF
jgi:hypothetical protein